MSLYIYAMEYYATIKKNELTPFAATCMDLEIIILKWNKPEINKQHDTAYTRNLKQILNATNELNSNRPTDIENKLIVA